MNENLNITKNLLTVMLCDDFISETKKLLLSTMSHESDTWNYGSQYDIDMLYCFAKTLTDKLDGFNELRQKAVNELKEVLDD